jgi:hypothetical protein
MRAFVRSVALFLFPLFVLNGLFYVVVDRIYFRSYLEHPTAPNFHTFLLADSHGLALGRLLERDGVYNFSAGGDSYIDMHRKLLFLLNTAKVERVILIADDHTLSNYRVQLSNEDRSYQLLNFHDYAATEPGGFPGYVKNVLMTHYLVFSSAKSRDLLKVGFKGLIFPIPQGTTQDWKSIQNKRRAVLERVNVQFPGDQRSPVLTERLLEIIRLCRARNIELVGIKFPLTKDYLGLLGNRSFGADGLLKAQGIRILDFKRAFADDDSLFANQDHLNEGGGEALSQIIAKDLGPSNDEIHRKAVSVVGYRAR